ncbi:MAG: DUF2165 domain-containing protein [Robiginitomaculum sp.]|nr:DUF2165 domain-containing protein [Robiginitomaculum sp.]
MLRIMKILLILCVALWGLLGTFGNLHDWSGTIGGVAMTTSMSTFEGGTEDWRATSNPVIIFVGAAFILIAKAVTGLLCLVGAHQMWTARKDDTAAFAKAKILALTGCAVAMFMLFGGFIVIAESWFGLWQSKELHDPVLASAFRYGGMIALIALFVGARDD